MASGFPACTGGKATARPSVRLWRGYGQTVRYSRIYEQIHSCAYRGGLRYRLSVLVVDAGTDCPTDAEDAVAGVHAVLRKPQAGALRAPHPGGGVLLPRLVQQGGHAQVVGWLLRGHDDGFGAGHGAHNHRHLAADAGRRNETHDDLALNTPVALFFNLGCMICRSRCAYTLAGPSRHHACIDSAFSRTDAT